VALDVRTRQRLPIGTHDVSRAEPACNFVGYVLLRRKIVTLMARLNYFACAFLCLLNPLRRGFGLLRRRCGMGLCRLAFSRCNTHDGGCALVDCQPSLLSHVQPVTQ
jgi:hypothetical protein